MNHAQRILSALDAKLNAGVELTLYGRVALLLGFPNPPNEFAGSRDVDAVLWVGQAEALNDTTNFWDAVRQVNEELAEDDLYISHFFTEDQVVLRPCWREQRERLSGEWSNLSLYRLGNPDLLLSKLMRDDPIDQADARFIVERARFSRADILHAIREARVPSAAEVEEQFRAASARLLAGLR